MLTGWPDGAGGCTLGCSIGIQGGDGCCCASIGAYCAPVGTLSRQTVWVTGCVSRCQTLARLLLPVSHCSLAAATLCLTEDLSLCYLLLASSWALHDLLTVSLRGCQIPMNICETSVKHQGTVPPPAETIHTSSKEIRATPLLACKSCLHIPTGRFGI